MVHQGKQPKTNQIFATCFVVTLLISLICRTTDACCLPDFMAMDVKASINITSSSKTAGPWDMRIYTKASLYTNFRRQVFRLDLGPLLLLRSRGRRVTLLEAASFLLDGRADKMTAYVKAHGNSNCMEVPVYGKVGKDYQCFLDSPYSTLTDRGSSKNDVTTYVTKLMKRALLRVAVDKKCRPKHIEEVVRIPRMAKLTARLEFANRKRMMDKRKFGQLCEEPKKIPNTTGIFIPSFRKVRQALATSWFTRFAGGRK